MMNLHGPMISYFYSWTTIYFQLLWTTLCPNVIAIGLFINEPIFLGESATLFATPLDILPEWYFYQAFNLLRILSNKLLGLLAQIYVSAVMLLILLLENTSHYQNPFRRPVCSGLVMYIIEDSLWLSLGPISVILLCITFW